MAEADGFGVTVGLTVALMVGFGVGEEVALGVGVNSLVGEGPPAGGELVKITLIPSSGTGETTLFRPKANQENKMMSKMKPKIAAKYVVFFSFSITSNHTIPMQIKGLVPCP